MEPAEFQEIAHSGGKVTFRLMTGPDGRRGYQIQWSHCRPVATAIIAVWALPQGVVVCSSELGGLGSTTAPPPIPGCFQVMIASDSEGRFGQQCPSCNEYWRSSAWPNVCPYCGMRAEGHNFLTSAQRLYVARYCDELASFLNADSDGEHIIDLDAVADAVGKRTPKPKFYYAEISQQNKFTCRACDAFNDVLGRYCYCSRCGTRNDLQELEATTIPRLRERINTGGPYEECVKDAIGTFDSFVSQYVRQLVFHIPMTSSRKARFEKMRFHNLNMVAADLKSTFDIDVLAGLDFSDIEFAARMFHRRHVYEHNGWEADEKYIRDSGDTAVRPKQALRETQESAHRVVGLVVKMAGNLHKGFHEIFEPITAPIRRHTEALQREQLVWRGQRRREADPA